MTSTLSTIRSKENY